MEIRLENLTKVFTDKSGNQTRAVDQLTITIPSGKLVGLLGPSGCGKSTTLFMIAGLHPVTEGKIFFGEDDVTRLAPEKRGIGLVFQNYALYPHMTIRQNIMFPLENLNIKRQEAEKLVVEMAELVGIRDQLDKKPSQLSGGQQQRVAIARALVKKPRVLLLDEPLSNLDARLRLQTREEIKRIQRETGITTIFVTHDQEEAMSISDQMVVLNFGMQQQMDEPQVMYNKPDNIFVAKFLGNPPINIIEGEIKKGKIVLSDGTVLADTKIKDGKYDLGIRPEDFKVDDQGFVVDTTHIDHTGRDTMIRFMIGDKPLRALVESESVEGKKTIKLMVKAHKVHVFDKETGLVLS
ncbi:ABC transporter ATP-binding protein [Mariniplasma anaerobium]|uniref:Sugar ABC transporter ATP-binding protein n=1 Tax=Mariniplasma anaerobium TaxID=2735436 RepID=A0A7U9TKZ1_9MOLU|nr:ABC transporter ATP-binding protein [Mariniplasma anaerobium]BCR36868.1 sugar ABC transporter ATP-binding protein [Mariniplasma anaerobium]